MSIRARRVRAIEETARRLATEVDAGPEAPVLPVLAGEDADDELSPLRRSIGELAKLLSTQLKEVAKKSRNLEALIDAMDEPVFATDNAEAVLLCNRSAERMFDEAPGKLVGRPIGELFTHADLLELHAAARAGETRRGKVKLTTPTGARVFQVSAAPVPVAWGEGIFGAVLVLRDVTELDQAIQVKTDFVANASHELRTPVAAIKGAAETLEECLQNDPASASRFVRMILDHAARLEEMMRDLIDLNRMESADAPPTVAVVDLSGLQVALGGLFESDCSRRRLTLEFDIDPDLVGMHADAKLLMLILRNLIENAVRFAYEHTTVRVSASLVEAFVGAESESGSVSSTAGPRIAGFLNHGPQAPGAAICPEGFVRGIARFEVVDRGTGIPLAHQERVFERYYQVDPSRHGGGGKRGTGLGLSIVKHAVKTLGGRVGLSSVWKEGTKVWVEVPVLVRSGD